jgi:hypothetical protein
MTINAEQAQPSPRRALVCVGIGAAVGPVIAFVVTAALFPGTPYERALRWMLGAIPFGALLGWLISRLKRPKA